MKTTYRSFFIILILGFIIGVAQPALLYAGAETPEGNVWDPFVNTNPFKGGTTVPGTITIIYNPLSLLNFFPLSCSGNMPQATMFYSLRLVYNKKPYTYQGATQVCMGNFGTPGSGGQGDVVTSFLNYIMLAYFPGDTNLNITQWNLKSLQAPGISQNGLSFIADIQIAFK
jgi:hypothetical protein